MMVMIINQDQRVMIKSKIGVGHRGQRVNWPDSLTVIKTKPKQAKGSKQTKNKKRLGPHPEITNDQWRHTKLVEFQLTIKLNHKSDKGHTQPAAFSDDCYDRLLSPKPIGKPKKNNRSLVVPKKIKSR